VPDRLRELLDLIIDSVDDPSADGAALAERASFSRDHLDRIVARAAGESPVALRRRLLLERAAWTLRRAGAPASETAESAGFGSIAAFSRAFSRAYGVPPSAFAASGVPVELEAPNGIHFHPPGGLLVPGAHAPVPRHDLFERLLRHHLDHTRALLDAAATLDPTALARPLRPGLVVVWFEGEEASAAEMAERLVFTLEIWTATLAGEPARESRHEDTPAARLERFERVAKAFTRICVAIRDRGAWDSAFVDALCEPPEMFTYGGVVAHVLEFGALRRHHLASVLAELGAEVAVPDDPILWEQRSL
jgi:AraC family transcriptional regulator